MGIPSLKHILPNTADTISSDELMCSNRRILIVWFKPIEQAIEQASISGSVLLFQMCFKTFCCVEESHMNPMKTNLHQCEQTLFLATMRMWSNIKFNNCCLLSTKTIFKVQITHNKIKSSS